MYQVHTVWSTSVNLGVRSNFKEVNTCENLQVFADLQWFNISLCCSEEQVDHMTSPLGVVSERNTSNHT